MAPPGGQRAPWASGLWPARRSALPSAAVQIPHGLLFSAPPLEVGHEAGEVVLQRPHACPANAPGIAATPLAFPPRHTVRFEIIWHINTDAETIATFVERFRDALADYT
jgi:hypothetical protein